MKIVVKSKLMYAITLAVIAVLSLIDQGCNGSSVHKIYIDTTGTSSTDVSTGGGIKKSAAVLPTVPTDGNTVPTSDSTTPTAVPTDVNAVPVYDFKYFDVNHVLSTGQSLSVGAVGTPVLSTTQPFDNKMFATGVLAGGTNLSSFLPLVESGTETMSSSLANFVTDAAEKRVFNGLSSPQGSHRVLMSCHGVSGTAYAGIKKGTAAFTSGMAQVTAGYSISAAAGLTYVVRAVTVVHGESDHVAQNTAYKQNLVEWQSDYETGIKAIVSQEISVPMLHTQMSSWTAYGQATSIIPQAQLDAHSENPGKIILVGPKYAIAYAADGVHLTNEGYRHMGEYYAKVYQHVVLEGNSWEPVRPQSATLVADEISVVFYVPVPPLVFDTDLVTAVTNMGFEYTDDSGAPPAIASVTLSGQNSVKIKLAKSPTGAHKRIRYAYTGTAGAHAGATTGPRGNLRDCDATPSRYGYKLYNWAVHFDQGL